MGKNITITDLMTTKRVLRHMKKDLNNSEGWKNSPVLETADNLLSVLSWYADDLADEIRKKRQEKNG